MKKILPLALLGLGAWWLFGRKKVVEEEVIEPIELPSTPPAGDEPTDDDVIVFW